MRDMQRTSLVLTTILVLAQPAFATGMEHGDMVAVIRSADYPCQQVLDLQDTGDNAWREVTPFEQQIGGHRQQPLAAVEKRAVVADALVHEAAGGHHAGEETIDELELVHRSRRSTTDSLPSVIASRPLTGRHVLHRPHRVAPPLSAAALRAAAAARRPCREPR